MWPCDIAPCGRRTFRNALRSLQRTLCLVQSRRFVDTKRSITVRDEVGKRRQKQKARNSVTGRVGVRSAKRAPNQSRLIERQPWLPQKVMGSPFGRNPQNPVSFPGHTYAAPTAPQIRTAWHCALVRIHIPECFSKDFGNSGFIVGEKARNRVPFLPVLILSERSSPSRVRFPAPKKRRALDCCGPL